MTKSSVPRAPLAHTIPGVCMAIHAGRSKVYEEISAGRLKARKMGRKTIVLDPDLLDYLNNLPELAPKADGPEADACRVGPSPTPNEGRSVVEGPPESHEKKKVLGADAAHDEVKME